MLDTLRSRLILSHILPTLLVIPLLGIALVLVLENVVFAPALTRTMSGEARSIALVLAHHDEIWRESPGTPKLLGDADEDGASVIMLLAPDGRVVASNSATVDFPGLGVVSASELPAIRRGAIASREYHDEQLQSDVLEVLAPVLNQDDELLGYVRVARRQSTFYQDLLRLRYVIGGIFIFGLLGAATLAWLLALSIDQPLQQITTNVSSLVRGNYRDPLPQQGPKEVRVLSAEINTLVARLHDLEKARQQLLANLVHELGRPLGAMDTAIQALLRGASEDSELAERLLVGLAETTKRLNRLVDDLTRLHDQVLGPLELQQQPLALDDWLPTVLRPLQIVAQERGQQWTLEIEPGLPLLYADPVRLAQAVSNLVSNAVKFTPRGGAVAVCARASGTGCGVIIDVEDTGPGIPPEEQVNIFEPLYRGGTERRIKQGMGLGLGIARDLVVAHGGRLELESEPGLGSCFTIWLPCAPAS
jgi:signal transduction histidine kinase